MPRDRLLSRGDALQIVKAWTAERIRDDDFLLAEWEELSAYGHPLDGSTLLERNARRLLVAQRELDDFEAPFLMRELGIVTSTGYRPHARHLPRSRKTAPEIEVDPRASSFRDEASLTVSQPRPRTSTRT